MKNNKPLLFFKNIVCKYDAAFLYCLVTASFLLQFALMFNLSSIGTIFVYANIVLIFSWFLVFLLRSIFTYKKRFFDVLKNKIRKTSNIVFVLLLICLTISIVPSLFSNLVIPKKYIQNIVFVIFIFLLSRKTINSSIWFYIKSLSIILTLVLIFVFAFRYKFTGSSLSFGYDNPNLAAMTIASLISIFFLSTYQEHLWRMKIIFIIFIALLFWMLLLTNSRNAIIAIVFATLFFPIFLLSKYEKKDHHWFTVLFINIPVIVFSCYMLLYYSGVFDKMLFLGKTTGSREAIWLNALNDLRGHLFFGNYLKMNDNVFSTSQLHNVFVDYLMNYGLIGWVLVDVFLCLLLKKFFHTSRVFHKVFPFLSLYFLGNFEGGILFGCSIYTMLMFVIIFVDFDEESFSSIIHPKKIFQYEIDI